MTLISKAKKIYRKFRDPVYRLFRLRDIQFINNYIEPNTSVFAMNCFGGKIYQDLHRQYTSPTAGLFFTATDFNKILANIEVLKNGIEFLPNVKPYEYECYRGGYPLGQLKGTDIKIHFLHYNNTEDALKKWNSRVARFNFNNFIAIGFEQNKCTEQTIKEFSQLPIKRKFFFTTQKYNYPGVIFTPEYSKRKTEPDAVKYANVFYRHLVNYIKSQEIINS